MKSTAQAHCQAHCQAALIAAPSSGQGKTLLTAALARRASNAGQRVRVFKVGPDYLDPGILEAASRQAVWNLDAWIMGVDHCRQLLWQAAQDNDLVLVEGVMGMHDNQPSNAELARLFGLPVVLVMNAGRFAQTAAALVEGMEGYLPGVEVSGVIGNFVGSDNHHRLLSEAIGERYAGSVRRNDALALPERHLGLVQAAEQETLTQWLDRAADLLEQYDVRLDGREVAFDPADLPAPQGRLEDLTIAVARDRAFSFIYPANVHWLESEGARLQWFSPLADEPVPDCDAVWLPGGYPELHAAALDGADQSRDGIRRHVAAGRPLLAECGGMMYAAREIIDLDGQRFRGCGILDASFTMMPRFQAIGHLEATYPAGSVRGHTFHHSRMVTALKAVTRTRDISGGEAEGVYRIGNAVFGYMHHYFPSGPDAIAALFRGLR